MRGRIFVFVMILCACSALKAQNVRDAVAVVRPVYSENTVKFLNDFSRSLARDGYRDASDMLKSYAGGGFGTGFVYKDASSGKSYIITNRHVVAQAENVTVEFLASAQEPKKYEDCHVVATADHLDLAIVALPDEFTGEGLTISVSEVYDGMDVFSAGFPGLGSTPSWQLGKGIVSNAIFHSDALGIEENQTVIQHTAQVDPGSSGGPLLIADANAAFKYVVIGINTWKAEGREGANFAIRATDIDSFVAPTLQRSAVATREALETRAGELIAAAGGGYKKVFPLVSYTYISRISVSEFYDLSSNASKEAKDDIRANFAAGYAIESVRIGLADALSKNLSGKNVAVKSIGEIAPDGTAGVVFTIDGKDVSSKWIAEQGNWRVADFEVINIRTLEKGISRTYGYRGSIRLGVVVPFSERYDTGYELSFGKTYRTFVFSNFTLGYIKGDIEHEEYDPVTTTSTYSYERTPMVYADYSLGGQLPLRAGPFYVIPNIKALGGIAIATDPGLTYGFGGGVELAYKLVKRSYLLFGAGYKYRRFTGGDEIKTLEPLSAVVFHIGITY